mgnify:CR=1 FL=1
MRTRFVSPTDRVLYFKSLPLLRTLPLGELLALAEYAEEAEFPAGAELVRSDGPVRFVRYLTTGTASVQWGGVEVAIRDHRRPVGLEGALATRPMERRVVALEPCTVLDVRTEVVLDMLQAYPALRMALIQQYAQDVHEARGGLPALPEQGTTDPGTWPDRPLDLVSRLRLIYEGAPQADLNLDAILSICRAMREERVRAGTILWETDTPAHHGYLVVAGKVRCEVPGQVPLVLGYRHGIGGNESIAGIRRTYRAVAETDCVLLRMHETTMNALFLHNFGVARAWLGLLVDQYIQLRIHRAQEVGRASTELVV